jgi:hypothetical protein
MILCPPCMALYMAQPRFLVTASLHTYLLVNWSRAAHSPYRRSSEASTPEAAPTCSWKSSTADGGMGGSTSSSK